jgi:dihydroorotase
LLNKTGVIMHRRKFLQAAIAAAVFARSSRYSHAQSYDMIVRGGRVIDPSLHLDAIADIAITGNRIAAVAPIISAQADEELDATGKLVMPGLLDIHGHYARDAEGPHICLSDGVTGWVDGGSGGADNIDDMIAIARAAPQPARVLLNIGRQGVIDGGDTSDMSLANVDVAKAAVARNLDYVVGGKARLTAGVTANDREVLRRAQEVASYFDLPVMIHMGQSETPMSELIQLLKPGDIVTHMFAPPPNAIFDASGRILPEVLAARRRGIFFDVANGRIDHLRWDSFDTIMARGFWPDTISTDGFSVSRSVPGVVDFPNIMSKFVNFGGMGLSDVVAAGSYNASRIFPFMRDKGTLNVGATADIAVLELRQGSFDFLDNYEGVRVGSQRLFPFETLLGGTRVPRR